MVSIYLLGAPFVRNIMRLLSAGKPWKEEEPDRVEDLDEDQGRIPMYPCARACIDPSRTKDNSVPAKTMLANIQ